MKFLDLPDWLPWWVPILVLVPAGLWALAMLVMPFSVIGLKARLEGIEARLDEVQADIRSLVLRLPEASADRLSPAVIDQHYVQPEPARPPIPPAAREGDFIPRRPDRAAGPVAPVREAPARDELRADRPAPSPRAEPRLDWRR